MSTTPADLSKLMTPVVVSVIVCQDCGGLSRLVRVADVSSTSKHILCIQCLKVYTDEGKVCVVDRVYNP